MEDEIDLRQYIAVLFKRWKFIAILTVLAGAVALAVVLLTPQVYEARSRVSIIKGDTALLMSLAKSNNIAEEVGKEAAVNVKTADLTAGKILSAVQAKQQGTQIEFTAQSSDPAKSAFIANGWAQQYTAYVDNYFLSTGQTPQEARSYADSIKKIYAEKQKALLDFEAASDINDLKLLIELLPFQDKVQSLAGSARSEPAVKTSYYNYITRALSSQGPTGSDSKISIAIDQMPEVTAADVGNLVSLLESRAGVSQGILPDAVSSRIASLKGQLDEKTLQSTNLTVQRDAALIAYQAALNRVSAAEIAQATSGGYVRVTDKAVAPDAPLPRKWLTLVIALVAGFIVGVIGAFAAEYFGKTARKPEGGANVGAGF
jgi:capsular polysaccharide biosynthesis protein